MSFVTTAVGGRRARGAVDRGAAAGARRHMLAHSKCCGSRCSGSASSARRTPNAGQAALDGLPPLGVPPHLRRHAGVGEAELDAGRQRPGALLDVAAGLGVGRGGMALGAVRDIARQKAAALFGAHALHLHSNESTGTSEVEQQHFTKCSSNKPGHAAGRNRSNVQQQEPTPKTHAPWGPAAAA